MREALALADELDLSVVALELDSAWVKLHPDAPQVSACETLEEANALRVTCPPFLPPFCARV